MPEVVLVSRLLTDSPHVAETTKWIRRRAMGVAPDDAPRPVAPPRSDSPSVLHEWLNSPSITEHFVRLSLQRSGERLVQGQRMEVGYGELMALGDAARSVRSACDKGERSGMREAGRVLPPALSVDMLLCGLDYEWFDYVGEVTRTASLLGALAKVPEAVDASYWFEYRWS